MSGPIALAFGAGLLVPVSPGGFGLLSAVLTTTSGSYGDRDNRRASAIRRPGWRRGCAPVWP